MKHISCFLRPGICGVKSRKRLQISVEQL